MFCCFLSKFKKKTTFLIFILCHSSSLWQYLSKKSFLFLLIIEENCQSSVAENVPLNSTQTLISSIKILHCSTTKHTTTILLSNGTHFSHKVAQWSSDTSKRLLSLGVGLMRPWWLWKDIKSVTPDCESLENWLVWDTGFPFFCLFLSFGFVPGFVRSLYISSSSQFFNSLVHNTVH